MKKTLLLLPIFSVFLSGCGFIEGIVRDASKNRPNEFTVIHEEGKPNSFGECSKLTIRANNEQTGDLIIKRKDVQDAGVKELVIHKKDIQGQQVYIVTPDEKGRTHRTRLTILCDDKTNEMHQFPFDYYSHAVPERRFIVYNTSTIPEWEKWLDQHSVLEAGNLKSFILVDP